MATQASQKIAAKRYRYTHKPPKVGLNMFRKFVYFVSI
jgi:hypothetical protein